MMLRATAFPAPYNSVPVVTRSVTTHTNTCHSLTTARVIHTHSSLVSHLEFPQFRQPRVNLRAEHGGGFVAAATKKQQRRGGAGLAGMHDDFDDDEDDDDVDDEYDGGAAAADDDEDDADPLEQMRKWFKKKPTGFGEGKVYDTSVEDKLLEEMRQSREAQVANLKKLKNNPVKPGSNKSDQKKKDASVVPIGGRLRLVNLPKKKNIHRDLKSALQGIPGIINIVPAVSGNKKTRDPICKGFAFVDFKLEEDAVRFVELYSGQTITFGKIQKQIKCELVNARSFSSAPLELNKNLKAAPHLMVSASEEDSIEDSNMDDSALGSWDETTSDDSDDLDNEIYGEEQEGIGDNQESDTALKVDYDDSVEMRIDSEINSLPSEQINRNTIAEQHSSAKVKQENARKKSKEKAKKVSKLDVPGSAKRLKIKEKAVLSDVFSKYGLKAAVASKDS